METNDFVDINDLYRHLKYIEKGTITIPSEEYARLVASSVILRSLEEGGVDNWEWYGESFPTDESLVKEVITQFKGKMK